MATHRHRKLITGAPALPSATARPLKPTSLDEHHNAVKSLDTLVASGERVLLEFGLRGGHKFLIPNGVNPAGAERKYPDRSTARVVGRLYRVPLTPGHFIGVEIVALPSGPAQDGVVALGYGNDGAGGTIIVEVTYTNDDAQTVNASVSIDITASGQIHAAEPASAFHAFITKRGTAVPLVLQGSAEHWHKWTRGFVLADVVVKYVGSPRVVDGYITEHAHSIVVDTEDARWPTAMYVGGGGQAYPHPPSDYPISQITTDDPGGGISSIHRALYNHGRQLGPCLFGWTSATEHLGDINDWISYDDGSGDDEAPPYVVTGTTPTLVPHGITAESANNPGWATGCYARPVDHGNEFLDGLAGVLPVWVAAYCKVSGGTGNFTLTTDKWCQIKWTTTSTDWSWVLTPDWLEVGTSPENSKPARLWMHNSGANNTMIRDLAVFHQVR